MYTKLLCVSVLVGQHWCKFDARCAIQTGKVVKALYQFVKCDTTAAFLEQWRKFTSPWLQCIHTAFYVQGFNSLLQVKLMLRCEMLPWLHSNSQIHSLSPSRHKSPCCWQSAHHFHVVVHPRPLHLNESIGASWQDANLTALICKALILWQRFKSAQISLTRMKAMSAIYCKQDLICSCIKLTPDPGTHGFLNKAVSALN